MTNRLYIVKQKCLSVCPSRFGGGGGRQGGRTGRWGAMGRWDRKEEKGGRGNGERDCLPMQRRVTQLVYKYDECWHHKSCTQQNHIGTPSHPLKWPICSISSRPTLYLNGRENSLRNLYMFKLLEDKRQVFLIHLQICFVRKFSPLFRIYKCKVSSIQVPYFVHILKI